MDLVGALFPGLRNAGGAHSQRSYSPDPMGSRSRQSSQYDEPLNDQADNITWTTPFGTYSPTPATPGNIAEFRGAFFSDPGWWSPMEAAGVNAWDELRLSGIGYGLWLAHQPLYPVPVWKLTETPSFMGGFVLPATFLGQPLAPDVVPMGGDY